MRMYEVMQRCDEDSDFRERFLAAMRKLNKKEIEAIRLRFIECKEWRYIGFEMNYSDRQVQRYVRSGQDKLGVMLGIEINGRETKRKIDPIVWKDTGIKLRGIEKTIKGRILQ